MRQSDLKDRTKRYAVSVVRFTEELPSKMPFSNIVSQICRAAMSVGANYRAASRAKSIADFINKLKIVEEECDETIYFLEIILELLPNKKKEIDVLVKEANELLAITVASIKTARNRIIKPVNS